MFRAIGRRLSSSLTPQFSSNLESFFTPAAKQNDYVFNTRTQLSESFAKPSLSTPSLQGDANELPITLDPTDIREMTGGIQVAEIERQLSLAKDPHDRDAILRQASIELARQERAWFARDQQFEATMRSRLTGVYYSMKARPSFSAPDLLTMLLMVSTNTGDANMCVYETNYEVLPHKYSIFFTCINPLQMFILSDALCRLCVDHGISEAPVHKMFVTLQSADSTIYLDMGNVGVHLSFGSVRLLGCYERHLSHKHVPREEWANVDAKLDRLTMIVRNPRSQNVAHDRARGFIDE